ncbi:MerR family transcriptional regulator [Kiloniella antarctica]|uniref:MerR family transcriptional regulator n=1 Tax=Kiloniella antarctica TaxID=1550907 RepID=A0ABW5BJS9_9PROT
MYIGELANQSGLSIDTLRYYEKIGLLPNTPRDQGGRRVYQPQIREWIGFLQKLRAMDMGVKDMARYAALREIGPSTARERRKMLEKQRQIVAHKIEELSLCKDLLDSKVDLYKEMEINQPASSTPKRMQKHPK